MIAVRILAIICIMSFSVNSLAENFGAINKSNAQIVNTLSNKDNPVATNPQDNSNIKSHNSANSLVDGGDNMLSKIISADTKDGVSSSLMFGDEEVQKLEQALDAYKNNTPFKIKDNVANAPEVAEDNIKAYVYLGSILYHSPNNWSVWINDQQISARDNNIKDELYIQSINDHQAKIIWTMSISKWKILANKNSESDAPINSNNQVEFNFILGFNQTFVLNGGKIVEGKITSMSIQPSTPALQQQK